MKNLLKIAGLFVFLFILSCKKNDDNTVYTISGVLLENCNGTPKSNTYMEMFQNWFTGSGTSQRLFTYTDDYGRFKFEYKSTSSSYINLWYGTPTSTTKLVTHIPAKKNIDLKNVYIDNKVVITIKLQSDSAYIMSDTLYYSIGNIYGYSQLAGPFQNGLIDTIEAQKGFSIGENYYNLYTEETALYWGIGWQDFYHSLITWNTSTPYHKIPFTARGNCMVDTAYLNIP